MGAKLALRALGLIETRTLVGAITAADVILKNSGLEIKGKYVEESITIFFEGEISKINLALDVSTTLLRRIGELKYYHLISNPNNKMEEFLSSIKF